MGDHWDNQEVGWISATDTRGSATARFRASGLVGQHQVRVYTGYMGQGYLNHEQAPNAYLPRTAFVFRITPGNAAPAAYAEPYAKQPMPPSESAGASATVTPTQGPVLTHVALKANGLPANAPVSLVWGTWEGSRVSGNGFAPKETELTRLQAGADGRLEASLNIPDDLGGLHTISIRSGDRMLARTYFVIETSIVSILPKSGSGGNTGDDSSQRRRLDRLRQHLYSDVRQQLQWDTPAASTAAATRRQLHGGRCAGSSPH